MASLPEIRAGQRKLNRDLEVSSTQNLQVSHGISNDPGPIRSRQGMAIASAFRNRNVSLQQQIKSLTNQIDQAAVSARSVEHQGTKSQIDPKKQFDQTLFRQSLANSQEGLPMMIISHSRNFIDGLNKASGPEISLPSLSIRVSKRGTGVQTGGQILSRVNNQRNSPLSVWDG